MTDTTPSGSDGNFEQLFSEFGALVLSYNNAMADFLRSAGRDTEADAVRRVSDTLQLQVEALQSQFSAFLSSVSPAQNDAALQTLQASGAIGLARSGREVAATAARAGPAALGAIIAFIEPIKKVLELILDFFLPDGRTRQIIDLILQFIDNLLGNSAEEVAPETGTRVRRAQYAMYRQVREVNLTEAARLQRAAYTAKNEDDDS